MARRAGLPEAGIVSAGSHRSVASVGSVLSAGCVGSVASAGCVGSIASAGSVGSIASVGCVGSLASGSICSIGSKDAVGAIFGVPVAELLTAALLPRWRRRRS